MQTATASTINIERGIPIPPKAKTVGRAYSPITQTLRVMNVGDSFVITKSKNYKNLEQAVHASAKRQGVKITVRKQEDGALRVWRTA